MQEPNQSNTNQISLELPPIPDKLYFSIGEVSRLCAIKAYVLRYWEQEFQQLSPIKRRGNRRYYQRKDIILIREIKTLLYDQGFTIEGARNKLGLTASTRTTVEQQVLLNAIKELESLLEILEQ